MRRRFDEENAMTANYATHPQPPSLPEEKGLQKHKEDPLYFSREDDRYTEAL